MMLPMGTRNAILFVAAVILSSVWVGQSHAKPSSKQKTGISLYDLLENSARYSDKKVRVLGICALDLNLLPTLYLGRHDYREKTERKVILEGLSPETIKSAHILEGEPVVLEGVFKFNSATRKSDKKIVNVSTFEKWVGPFE